MEHDADEGVAVVGVEILIDDPALDARVRTLLGKFPDVEVVTPGLDEPATIVIADAQGAPARDPPAGFLILLGDVAELAERMRPGTATVLPRSASRGDLRLAIDAALHGFALVPSAPPGRTDSRSVATPALTPRELDVLGLMAEGASNKVIAGRLGISVHTAKFHVASILEKLDSTGRTDAVAQAVRLGLLML